MNARAGDEMGFALGRRSDPMRGLILEALAVGPLRTHELADRVGVSVPALSRHLKLLRQSELVVRDDVDGDGRGRSYRLRPEVLDQLGVWLDRQSWAERMRAGVINSDTAELLARMGAFLDAFSTGDRAFFERHLHDDVELLFPDADPINKTGCLDAVEQHPVWIRQTVTSSPLVRRAGPGVTVLSFRATVRHSDDTADRSVHISAVFTGTKPWQIIHLQWTPAPAPEPDS